MWFTVSVYNTPDYAENHNFIVSRLVENNLWFYGAYDEIEKAREVAEEIDGLVVVNVR